MFGSSSRWQWRAVSLCCAYLAAGAALAQDPDARGLPLPDVSLATPTQALPVPPEPLGGPPYASSGYRSLHLESTGIGSGFTFPFQVTADADNIFVSDVTANAVRMYQLSAGVLNFVRNIGTGSGSGAGQFNGPEQVAAVGNDLYVADFNNNRVQRFNRSTGAYVSQFGVGGSGAGQLFSPSGLVFNPTNGLLYVSDIGNDRIQTFTTAGVFVSQFSGPGAGDGQLNNPFVLAVDRQGNIYAADSGNNRVEKFRANGTFVRHIGTGLNTPLGLTVDNANLVWVTSSPGDIYAYDSRGSYVAYYYGLLAAGTEGYFANVRGLAAIAPQVSEPFLGAGGLAVVDAGTGTQRVQLFKRSTQPIAHDSPQTISGAGSFNGQIAFDSQQNVYVTSFQEDKISKYDRFGAFIGNIGSPGTGNGQLDGPYGITIDDQDNIYVVDRNNSRIQKFNASGVYVTQWGSLGSGDGQFSGPADITTDGSWLYVTDELNARVQKFSLSGTYVRKWGMSGTGNGQFTNPAGITVDRNRQKVYVAEYFGNRIQEFSVFGDFVKVIADSTSGTGMLSNPRGLDTDQRGNLYCADGGNSRIVQYNDNGTYLGNTPVPSTPNGLAFNRANNQMWVGTTSGGTVSRVTSVVGKSDSIGVYRPGIKTFLLRQTLTTGPADIAAQVPDAAAGDVPLVGDWNGDGIDSPGFFRASTSTFYLWDRWVSLSVAQPDYQFAFCTSGDKPLVGDWDGDGIDGIGCFRASNGTHYFKNKLAAGAADYAVTFAQAGDIGVVGDWDRDGTMSAGVFRPSDGRFHVTNANIVGTASESGNFLLGQSGDVPLTGDWTHIATSGIAVFRPSNATFYIKHSLDDLAPNSTFGYQPPDPSALFVDGFETVGASPSTDIPLTGVWGNIPE